MQNFFYQTNLSLITPNLKQSILNLFENEFDEYITLYHKMPNEETKFVSAKVTDALNDEILNRLPKQLVNSKLDPYVRVQYTANGKLIPHIDAGRVSGLITVLTDDNSESDFYEWAPGASEKMENLWVVDTNELVNVGSTIFKPDVTYLFNHASIHAVTPKDKPRITLNILYQKLPYTELVKIYSKLTDQ